MIKLKKYKVVLWHQMMDKEVSWARSQARMVQQEGKRKQKENVQEDGMVH